ncbi:MAG: crossover junction endodeoxyribonuclease RuvC [Legionellales bacterium]|nr:crossover junction endodeoxyribonuclease RuvC [Legionellales bacterium]|tara:strand:+ start:1882 stop:2370 length:489 start_codon:yes stop_codon:yes gene_type:complete
MIILGIDPGSCLTGFGIVESISGQYKHRAHGTIKPKTKAFNDRVYHICNELSKIIQQYNIDAVAIEQTFVNKNAQTSLKLGQVRGAIILQVMQHGLDAFEYTPRSVKSTVTGYGAADKRQIMDMITMRLRVPAKDLTSDSADALAIAICHLQNTSLITNGVL